MLHGKVLHTRDRERHGKSTAFPYVQTSHPVIERGRDRGRESSLFRTGVLLSQVEINFERAIQLERRKETEKDRERETETVTEGERERASEQEINR